MGGARTGNTLCCQLLVHLTCPSSICESKIPAERLKYEQGFLMRLRATGLPLTFGISLLLLWYFVTEQAMLNPQVLPHPATVLARLHFGVKDGFLLTALISSLKIAGWGCVYATLIGVPCGILITRFRLLGKTLEPYVAASQAIPAIAIAPLLVTWAGYGTKSIVILCTVIVIFPIIVNTAVGIKRINPDLLAAAQLDGANARQNLIYIALPLASPLILAGMRNGFTLAITGAIVGEMVIGSSHGLGITLISFQHQNDMAGMFACIILLASIAVLGYSALQFIERRVGAVVAEN